MCVSFNTMYVDADMQAYVNRRAIATHYLKSWFFVDLISTVPIDRIIQFFIHKGSSARLAKMVRILRLTKLLKLLRVLKLSAIMGSTEVEAGVNPAFFKMFKLIFGMMFVAHLLACIWFYLASHPHEKGLDLDQRKVTWLTQYALNQVDVGDINVDNIFSQVGECLAKK
jgi:hypothetical protein